MIKTRKDLACGPVGPARLVRHNSALAIKIKWSDYAAVAEVPKRRLGVQQALGLAR
jgi:hypothetical protein